MDSYILKEINNKYSQLALYYGENRLTDVELATLFDTAGEIVVEFENPTTVNGYWAYIRQNDDSTTVLQFQVSGVGTNNAKAWKLAWGNKPTSGVHSATSFTQVYAHGLTDSQWSFLMSQIKAARQAADNAVNVEAQLDNINNGSGTSPANTEDALDIINNGGEGE